jgi:hypothetical protein
VEAEKADVTLNDRYWKEVPSRVTSEEASDRGKALGNEDQVKYSGGDQAKEYPDHESDPRVSTCQVVLRKEEGRGSVASEPSEPTALV